MFGSHSEQGPVSQDSCFSYLKQGFSRSLPEDRIAWKTEYRTVREGLKPFISIILGHRKTGAVAGLFLPAASLLAFPQPMITRFLMDRVLLEKQPALVAPVIALMAAVALGQTFSGILQVFFSTRFQQNVTLDIQKNFLERTLSPPKAFK